MTFTLRGRISLPLYCESWPRGMNVAPGVNWVSSQKLRPFNGSSATCDGGTRWLTSVDVVESSGTAASTVTSCVVSPSCSVRSTVDRSPVCKVTLPITSVLNPLKEALSVYSAGSRLGNEYWPEGSLTVLRVAAVPLLRSVTAAPGIAAPVSSFTVPSRLAWLIWA